MSLITNQVFDLCLTERTARQLFFFDALSD